mmetsp:Transcript_49114/g.128198  ORF Transcript_49114/g.128198 Transcript_49114/m.128198 type:complete len:529 (+) Transcript_49114:1134-2720(+)
MSAELLRQLPPTLLQVGDAEVVLSDTTELAARAVEAGAVGVELLVYRHMWHCWPMYSMLPTRNGVNTPLVEAKFALEDLGEFIQRHAPHMTSPQAAAQAAAQVTAQASPRDPSREYLQRECPFSLGVRKGRVCEDMKDERDDGVCCVCMEKPAASGPDLHVRTAENGLLRLSCDHVICKPCSTKAAHAAYSRCPICRRPHELNPSTLRNNAKAFRRSYQNWRKGASRGARSEITHISGFQGWRILLEPMPLSRGDQYSTLAGLLFVLDKHSPSLPPSSAKPVEISLAATTFQKGMRGPPATPTATEPHPTPRSPQASTHRTSVGPPPPQISAHTAHSSLCPLEPQPAESTSSSQAWSLHHALLGTTKPNHAIVFAWWPPTRSWARVRVEERSMRALSALRPGLDYIALADLPNVRQCFSMWCTRYEVQPWQAIWFPPLLEYDTKCRDIASHTSTVTHDPSADTLTYVLGQLRERVPDDSSRMSPGFRIWRVYPLSGLPRAPAPPSCSPYLPTSLRSCPPACLPLRTMA